VRPAAAHVVLFAALLCVSTSGPFFIMTGMDAYAVVFWRLALAAPILFGWAALRRELRVVPGEGLRLVLGGVALAVHWVLWVKAFDLTDYASNLLLLVAQPIVAGLVEVRLGARSWRTLAAPLALSVAGLVLIAGGDFGLGGRALLGDLLCILAGVAITAFYVITARARAGMPLSTFMGITFVVGAAAVAPLVWLTGVPLGGGKPGAALWLGGLVLVTTVAGHGLLNLAARHVGLFIVNLIIVLEPAIAIALGALLFGATIGTLTTLGGALLIAAVLVGMKPSRT